ncbi:cupin [Actinobaculum sp. 352]|uniref:cupin n=1 Tax=Actinobaculum sp. 352 TaxID=2490946 RepID=UPI000F7DA870|nr:cupin [Actinobaculum sp. 352]RTE50823.1 cupin [Actinobaculum sp. 352]
MADLMRQVTDHLEAAQSAEDGRSAELVARDGVLRQTIIALRSGTRLRTHNSPPAASLQVLAGKVRVEIGDELQGEFKTGELWVLTHERHSVLAVENSAFLLTTVTSTGEGSHA